MMAISMLGEQDACTKPASLIASVATANVMASAARPLSNPAMPGAGKIWKMGDLVEID